MNKSQLSWAVIWIGLLITPFPWLVAYFQGMYQLEQYSFLPLLAFSIAYLVWDRWDRVVRQPNLVSMALIALGVMVHGGVLLLPSSWIATLGWYCVLASVLASHKDVSHQYSLLTILPLAILGLRIPGGLDLQIPVLLQSSSSQFASFWLDLLEIPHLLNGNVFTLVGGVLFVEEACSGVQSVYALVFLALCWITYLRRPFSLYPLYLCIAIFWAWVFNVFRIVVIAWAQEVQNYDLAHGVQHDVLGYFCLIAAILLFASTDRFLAVAFMPVPRKGAYNPLSRLWNKLFHTSRPNGGVVGEHGATGNFYLMGIAGSFLVLSLVFSAFQGLLPTRDVTPFASDKSLWSPDPALLTEGEPNFRVVGYERVEGTIAMPMGRFADVWKIDVDGLMVTVALCQPYPEPHDLTDCYKGVGWNINRNDRRNFEPEHWNASTVSLLKNDGRFAHLFFSYMDGEGRRVDHKPFLWDALTRRWRSLRSGSEGVNSDEIGPYQVIQLWAEKETALTATEEDRLWQVHLDTRRRLQRAAQRLKEAKL